VPQLPARMRLRDLHALGALFGGGYSESGFASLHDPAGFHGTRDPPIYPIGPGIRPGHEPELAAQTCSCGDPKARKNQERSARASFRSTEKSSSLSLGGTLVRLHGNLRWEF